METTFDVQYQNVLGYFPKIVQKEVDKEYYAGLNALLQTLPNYSERQEQALSILCVGTEFFNKDQYDEAYIYFENSKSLLATPDAWFYCGMVNFQKENYERAIQEFSAAILLFEEYGDAHFFRGKSIYELLHWSDNTQISPENNDLFKIMLDDLFYVFQTCNVEIGDVNEAYTMIKEVEYWMRSQGL